MPLSDRQSKSRIPLTTNQSRGFLAAWGGWVLDGMDSFIYALVMAPALRELLPRSGIPNDQAHVGYYGGLLFALFLIGWGCSLVWGPIADRFGRVLTLMLTILCVDFTEENRIDDPYGHEWGTQASCLPL